MTCSPKPLRSPRTVMTGIAVLRDLRHRHPIELKNTANTELSTITRKIDWTTAVVVREPTSSLLPCNQHALEAAGKRDDEAEHRRLDERDPKIGERNDFLEALDVGQRRDPEVEPDEQAAAEQRGEDRPEGEQRHHQDRRHHPRQDERFDRRHADRPHGVDLLGDLHRPDLGGEGRARAAGDHDRGHQHAELAHRDPADEVDGVDLGAELGELDRALLGDDDADEEAHQADDPERADPDDVEARYDRVEAEALGPADDIGEADQDRAEKAEQADQSRAHLGDPFAKLASACGRSRARSSGGPAPARRTRRPASTG